MTLPDLLSKLYFRTPDNVEVQLYHANGVLSREAEAYVSGESYYGLPYAYLLHFSDARTQVYDNGSGRYLNPIDVVFESRDLGNAQLLNECCAWLGRNLKLVTELRPGVPLATELERLGGTLATSRRQGLVEASLRLHTSFL